MREYFIGVMSVIFFGGMITSLSPSAKGQKYLRLLCSLSVVGSIVLPIFSAFREQDFDVGEFAEIFETENASEDIYGDIYNGAISDASILNAEITLKSEILREVSAKEEDFDVMVNTSLKNDVLCIESVTVKIYPSGIFINPREIENYVNERLECPCTVVYESG